MSIGGDRGRLASANRRAHRFADSATLDNKSLDQCIDGRPGARGVAPLERVSCKPHP
jgi:hypothetical protein